MTLDLNRLNAYTLVEEGEVSDIHSHGYFLKHKKSGARICVASNTDNNKVFYIAFRTPPKDSTGVAHIIEHTVLCGSEKFPLKDPFIELAKGSLNTFLNAMTYPDKTVYPVASCNDKDFRNLMDVYMDSVLHPNIYKEENIFKQEGWHYELNSPEDDIIYNGVVYNEMKGAFSSPDSVLSRSIINELYPDTSYANESGGDPEFIPDLTYQDYLDFHSKYYHPSNSYIFLWGDMDVEENLEWLDREYLCKYDVLDVDSEIKMQAPFAEPKVVRNEYSISTNEDEQDNTFLSYSWSVGTNLDPEQYIAFDILDHALLSSQGAPIKQALLDAGIGYDIYGGYDADFLQPTYSVIARNANEEDADKFKEIIFNVLKEQVEKGLNKQTLLAAINSDEFKFREADFGRYPKGLILGLQIMDSWLYDDADPFRHLRALDVYASLREKIDTGYFEGLIEKYLLNNNHAAMLIEAPKKGLSAVKEQAVTEKLAAFKASLSEDEINKIIADTQALLAFQEEPTPKEALETIPLLSRDDMKKVSEQFSNIESEIEGIKTVVHDYDTNGIVNFKLVVDTTMIPQSQIPYLGIISLLMGKMNTEQYTYSELADQIDLYTGGMSASTRVYSSLKEDCIPKFETGFKTLVSNIDTAKDLFIQMLFKSEYTDYKHMKDLLAGQCTRLKSDLSDSGNQVASTRALSYISKGAKYSEMLSGIDYYKFLSEIVDKFDEKKEEITSSIVQILGKLLQPQNIIISITGDEKASDAAKVMAKDIIALLNSDEKQEKAEIVLSDVKNEGFTNAAQIQYVAMAGNYSLGKVNDEYVGAFKVLRTIMNYEYLWQNIRVKGGAYGCGFNSLRNGEVYFSSYRDPNLENTIQVYKDAVEFVKNFEVDDRDMTKYVIGTFSEIDMPNSPAAAGTRSMTAYLSDITFDMIQSEREQVVSTTCADIRALADKIERAIAVANVCAIGNENKISASEGVFEHIEAL